MVAPSTSAPENLNTPDPMQEAETVENDGARRGGEISDYELCREERIRENRERMQKLGIFDISQKLNARIPTPRGRPLGSKAPRPPPSGLPKGRPLGSQTHQSPAPLPPPSSTPVRRSSRLQSSTPVSYCEIRVEKKDELKGDYILREDGSRPEVYTEEHDKVLGSTEMSWTLFVDGYGKDGKRIYDPIKGKTCHQCRQKTLGHRTHCSNCNMVQGQFCGDCLFMRYGENVLEAKANPDWTCPVCRGICNCSLCRQAKGWPPTGTLYKKVSSLGYKSVAHYLIQTRRANKDTDDIVGGKVPVSAKRSLPFSDVEVTVEKNDLSKPSSGSGESKLAPESGDEPLLIPVDEAPFRKDQDENALKPEHENDSAGGDADNETILLELYELDKSSTICATVIEPKTTTPLNDEVIKPEPLERSGNDAYRIEKENSALDNKDVASETSPKCTKKRGCNEPAPDSIGARLRKRRNENSALDNDDVASETSPKCTKKRGCNEPASDSIGTRLRNRGNGNSALDNKDVIASETSPNSTVKRACFKPTPDSIGARLRRRRDEADKI